MARIEVNNGLSQEFLQYAITSLPKTPDSTTLILTFIAFKGVEIPEFLKIVDADGQRPTNNKIFRSLHPVENGADLEPVYVAGLNIRALDFADFRAEKWPLLLTMGSKLKKGELHFSDVASVATLEYGSKELPSGAVITLARTGADQDMFEPVGPIGSWWVDLKVYLLSQSGPQEPLKGKSG